MSELTGAALRSRRRALGCTQRELATELGVTANTIARWERGELPLGNPTMIALALDELARRAETDRGAAPRAGDRYGVAQLPAPASALVARERERRFIRRWSARPGARLLTLVGSGGTGKTHLAFAAAADVGGHFADGARAVELAAVDSDELVVPAIGAAFGVHDEGALLSALASAHALVVLDNCEHVRGAVASFVAEALRAAPSLRVLATSRAPLRVRGEQLLEIEPLAVPDRDRATAPAALARVPSVQLFVERWRSRDARCRLTAANARAVADICVRLEGLPLAIELAATQAGVHGLADLAARLDHVVDLANERLEGLPARHRSLRAVQQWSYDILDADSQRVFRRLGVFSGGFTIDAAHAVVGDDHAMTSACVARLHECHLVAADGEGEAARYRMLEPVREFAHELLVKHGEHAATRARHAEHYTTFVETGARWFWDRRQVEWLALVDRELANVRVALAWCRSSDGSVGTHLRLAVAMRRYWDTRGPLSEAREHFHALLAIVPDDTPRLAYLPIHLAMNALKHEDVATAEPLLERALPLAERDDDHEAVSIARQGLSLVACVHGDMARAEALARGALDAATASGIRGAVANATMARGIVRLVADDLVAAQAHLEDALAIAREVGDRWVQAEALIALGNVRFARGDVARARADLVDSLRPLADLGNRPRIAICLRMIGTASVDAGDLRRAAMLLGAADSLAEAVGHPWPTTSTLPFDRAVKVLRDELGDERLARLQRTGGALSLDAVIALARGDAAALDGGAEADPAELSARESEVLRLVASGNTNRAIADVLGISPRTVGAHVEHIMMKLRLHSRTQLAVWLQDRRSS